MNPRLISAVDQIESTYTTAAPKFAYKIEMFFDGKTVLEFFKKIELFRHQNLRII